MPLLVFVLIFGWRRSVCQLVASVIAIPGSARITHPAVMGILKDHKTSRLTPAARLGRKTLLGVSHGLPPVGFFKTLNPQLSTPTHKRNVRNRS